MSVSENVFLGNEQTSVKGVIDWTKTHKHAQEMLARVGLENENLNAPVSSLGVGKQQLIEIAKAMAKKVELLILDEPTAALNDEESQRLLEIMLDLKKHGITCIIISHKLNEISYVADSITVIRDGKTIETLDKEKDDISEDRIIKGLSLIHISRQSAIGLPFIQHRQYGGREYAVTEYTMSEIVASVYEKRCV